MPSGLRFKAAALAGRPVGSVQDLTVPGQAGVPVPVHRGVTHEFSGMGAVVADAPTAVQQAGMALRGAFRRR